MAAVAGDVTSIHDEELLRRMWQDTEDFGRKKEIRARMYKLREQRLKEFYTTGEVLSDVLTTGIDAIKSASNTQQQVIQKSASYTTSSTGGNFAITHADSFADEGFMTLKSKEIRDSESPTRDFHRRQQMDQEDSQQISQEYQNLSQDGGGDSYWKVSQESSSQDFKSSGKTGTDGKMIVNTSSRSEQHKMSGDSNSDGLQCVSQVVETANTDTTPAKEIAIKDFGGAIRDFGDADNNTSVVVSGHTGGRTLVSATSQKWSSSQSSKREERTSSSSTTSSSTRVVHKDSGFSDDFQNKDFSESTNRKDSLAEQAGSRKSSLTIEGSRKSSLASDSGSRKSSLTTPSGKYRITQRSSTTEVPFGDLGVATDDTSTTVKTSKTGETMTIDINVANKQEETSSTSRTEEKSTLDEKKIMSELQKLDTFLSTQKSASTPASPGDATSWTVVSGQQTGRDVNDKTEEFVFHVGRNQEVSDVTNSSSFIAHEKSSIQDSCDKTETVTDDYKPIRVRESSPEKKPAKETSPEKKPVSATTPTEPKKGIMKQPSQDKMETTGQYVTTYTEHFTNKRISVETDRNHDAFAKSLRSSTSPEKGTPTSTRSSSKMSLDRSSPTRNYRNKTSADSSLASLNRTSPTRKSPGRASPEKSVSPSKKTSPSSDKDRTSPTRSTRQQSPDKKTSPSRDRTSDRTSPTRSTRQQSPDKKTSPSSDRTTDRTSPTRFNRQQSPDKKPSSDRTADRTSPTRSTRQQSPDKKTSPSDRTSPTRYNREQSPDKVSSPSRTSQPGVRGVPESPTRGTSQEKPAVRRSSSARNSPEKDTRGKSPDKLNVDKASRRVSAGDKPRTDVTSKISVTSTIKDKRRLSSGVSKAATKKRCSTPGASPTHDERQSRPRSRGSSRSASESDGSGSESRTYTRDTEEDTRRYQQSVMEKEELLMTTTSKEINVDQGSSVTIDISNLLKQERSPQAVSPGPDSSDVTNVTIELTVTDVDAGIRDVTIKNGGSSPVKSPALSKVSRDRSPEYSSEGSLANELPRRSAPGAPRDSPVQQARGGQDSPDTSPERPAFTPIKQFRTSPEPNDVAPNTTHAPTAVSPAVITKSDVGTTSIKESIKPEKPISTRPVTTRKSPQRPNSSPAHPEGTASKPDQKSPIVFKFTKPRSGSPSVRVPSSPSTDKSARVPEVTRRSPTPESPTRRAGRPSDSSSVSPCSSPERQSDRENSRHRPAPKKSPLKKKPVDSEKTPRGYSPDKSPRDRSSSPEKTPTKKKSVSPKDAGRRSESPIKATPVRRASLPRRLSKEAVKPQYSDSSPERESPDRRTVRPPQKAPANRGGTPKSQPSQVRPSSIPRAGATRKPIVAEVKPLERKPSWSKTLRGTDAPRETHKTTKTIVLGRYATTTRSASADSKPQSRQPKTDVQPSRRRPSPTSSPERKAPSSRPQRRPDASPVKSAFVRTNSKPTEAPRKPEVPRFTATTKLTPKSGPLKCKCPEDHSTDRSSSLSSPETVRPRDNQPRPERLMSSSDAEDRPVNLELVTGVVKSFVKVHTATEDYFSDEYEDVLDETPPEEFLVDDDSPTGVTKKVSSIPTAAKKEPIASSTPIKPSPVNKSSPPENKTSRPTPSTSSPGYARPKSQEPKKTPIKLEPTKLPAKAPQNKPKPEQPKTFRSVATMESRITRSNSDKNVIRRQSPSPSGVVNRRQTSKPELPVSRLTDKTTSATTRSTARQQVNTSTTVTTRSTSAKTITNRTTTPVKTTPVNKKQSPVDSVKKAAPLKPTPKALAKKLNGVEKQPEFMSSSSDEEEGLPNECPSLIDTDDEEYSREMEELRREEESKYASRVTSREDALLSICQDKLKTSRDSLTIVDIRLKSSRESSPDSRAPRYADRVSEPETDDDFAKKPEAVRFQRPVLQPNPLDEETDEEPKEASEPKAAPKVYPKSILTPSKVTPSAPPQTPKTGKTPVAYPGGEIDESQPKRPSEYLQRGPREFPADDEDFVDTKSPRDYPPQKPLQVTDLDASDTEESLRLSVSVSDRVSHFLEEAVKAQSIATAVQTADVPTRLSTLDSPSAVNKARAMFETIAVTQTSPPSPRQKDILSRPSVFEARRNGPWASPQEKKTPKPTSQPKSTDYPSDEEVTIKSKVSVDISSKTTSTTLKSSSPRDSSPTSKTSDASPRRVEKTDTYSRRTPSLSPDRPTNTSPKESYLRDKSPTGKPTSNDDRRKPTSSPERNGTPRDTYPRDKSPPGKTTTNDTFNRRKPSSSSPERPVTRKDSQPSDESPPGKISTDTFTKSKPSSSPERSQPRDKSPPGKISTDTFTRSKPSSSPERSQPRDKSPPGKISTDTFTRRKPSSSPERSQPSDKSPPGKISTDTFTRRKPSSSPERSQPRDKSPPGKISTDTFTRRKPSSSPERSQPRDKSPPGKISTDTFTRRKPSSSPERSQPRDKSPPGKISTDTFTRRKPSSSPERSQPRDKSPPGKISTDTFTRRKPSSSPERSQPRDKSPPGKITTDTFTRRTSTERTTDYGTYTKPKPQQEKQSPEPAPTAKPFDKYASFPSQTRGSRIKVDEAPDSPTNSPEGFTSARKPSKDDLPDIMDILAIRRGSIPKKEASSPIRRDSTPKKDTSPVRKDSLPRAPSQDSPRRTSPTRQAKEAPQFESPRRDSSTRDTSPTRDFTGRGSSPTRKPKDSPTRKDSLPKDSKRIVSLETSSTRGSGVFGVALRSTTATTNTTPRRRSDAKPKPEDEDENIEEIFELDVLETMLEKAVGYDKRRRLRAQIRIVRRQLEISTSTTNKTTSMTSSRDTNRSTATVELSSRRQSPSSRPTKPQEEPRKVSTSDSPARPQGRRPSDSVDARQRTPSPQKSVPVEDDTGSRPGSNAFVKKLSKTELTIELKTSSSPAVKTPAKKWSIGEAPQDACPVTSSYGVGPTDENGRPLFGLRALRKSHNSQSQTDSSEPKTAPEPEPEPDVVRDRSGRPLFGGLRALQTKTTVDTSSTTTSVRRDSRDASTTSTRKSSTDFSSSPTRRDSVKDNSIRKDSVKDSFTSSTRKDSVKDSFTTSTRKNSTDFSSSPTRRDSVKDNSIRKDSVKDSFTSSTRKDSVKDSFTTSTRKDSVKDTFTTSTRRDSGRDTEEDEENKMPEQPESPQLRDLVTRHEQRVRGAETSQPLQKPRAKLRDTFILPTSTTPKTAVATETTRSASHRAQALRSLIQKHESIAKDDELSLGSRPGILKKSRDDVVSESHSRSTVVTSRGTMRSDGTVSLTRDVIKGETVQRSGEEPVTRVTRSTQRYDTPQDKQPLAIEDVEMVTPTTRKASSSSPSPERFCGTRDERRFVSSTSMGRTTPERSEKLTSNRRSSVEAKTPTRRQVINDDDDDVTNKSTSRYTTSTTVTTSKQVSNQYSTGEDRRSSQGYIVDYNDDDESDGYQGSTQFIDVSSKTSSPRGTPDRVIPDYNKTDSSRRRSSTPLDEDRKTPTRTITRGNSIRALQEKFQQAAATANNFDTSRSSRAYPKAGLIFRSASFKLSNGSSPEPGSPASLDAGVTTSTTTSSRSQTTTQTESPRSFINNQTRVTGVQDILTRMRNADHVVESGDTLEDTEARALLNKFLGAQVILQGMEPLVTGSKQSSTLVTQVERHMEPLVKVSQQSAALVRQVERQRVLSTSSSNKLQSSSSTSNGREEDVEDIWDEAKLRRLLDSCTDYEGRRKIRARLRVVMAEQKACSDIVSAARADQAAAAGDAGGAVELRSEQGESLLLPLLVQQLRYRATANQASSEIGVDDSGTESGEDLKLLAVGLRDSIEQQRQTQTTSTSEPLGPSLLAEVQTALSRLEASLTLGDSELDATRRDALLQLVARLQASLRLPAPPWSKVDPKLPTNKRFSNKKQRQNRHTVGVSREELADARRLMEETSLRDKLSEKKQEPTTDNSSPAVKQDMKQSSAENLSKAPSSEVTPVPVTGAFRAFRPVHFVPPPRPPQRSSSGSSLVKALGGLVPFPFDSQQCGESPTNAEVSGMQYLREATKTHKPLVQTMSLDSGAKEYVSNKTTENFKPFIKNESSPVYVMPARSEVISQYMAEMQGADVESPSAQMTSPLRSTSGSSVTTQPTPYSRNNSSQEARRSSQSSVFDSNPTSKETTPLRVERQISVTKVKPPPIDTDISPQKFEQASAFVGRILNKSTSGSSDTGRTESTPQRQERAGSLVEANMIKLYNKSVESKFPDANSKQLTKAYSLDAGALKTNETADVHKARLDTRHSDYDPSVLLFTPAQSVQIAIHKAAINKQISREEEKRGKKLRRGGESESSEEMVSSEESCSDTDEDAEDEEEDEESSTLKQTPHVQAKNDVNARTAAYKVPQQVTGEAVNGMANKAQGMPTKQAVSQSMAVNGVKAPKQGSVQVNGVKQEAIATKPEPVNKMIWGDKNGANHVTNGDAVNSAQRLLQMATAEDPTKPRFQGRKLKMKRANTIDIPKPLNFYQVDADSDCSSDGEDDNQNDVSNEHRASYLALRGPIRVGGVWPTEPSAPPPNFTPKTDSDHKFMAFINKGGSVSGDEGSKPISYNPSARGGQPWSNRFSNIKTAFERGKSEPAPPVRARSNSGPVNARTFWQTADDSATLRKSSTPASNGPTLTRQGSIFLQQLHQQKDQQTQQGKLPWTDKKTEPPPTKLPWNEDSVVVGSLMVAAKGVSGTVNSKKQIFTPPPSPSVGGRPVNVNKFSHNPMSAFRPIEKKPTTGGQKSLIIARTEPLTNPTSWGPSSVSGSVKQLAKQKFNAAPPAQNGNSVKPAPPTHIKLQSYQPKQELLSPVSPTLPWTQKALSDTRGLSSTTRAKFEPPPPAPRQSKPEPPPRAYLNVPKPPLLIPSPPSLAAPILVQNYDAFDEFKQRPQQQHSNTNGQVQYKPSQEKHSQPVYKTEPSAPKSTQSNYLIPPDMEPPVQYSGCVTSRSSVYPNTGFQYTIPERAQPELSPRPFMPSEDFEEFDNPPECAVTRYEPTPPQQTYTEFINNINKSASPPKPTPTPPQLTYTEFVNSKSASPPKPPPNINLKPLEMVKNSQYRPDALNSPEEMQAVSRVMTGPVCHQAQTVSHKPRHVGDGDEPEGRSSAARNLSSLLNRLSDDDPSPQRSPVAPSVIPSQKQQQISSHKSPTAEALQNYKLDNEKFLEYQPPIRAFQRTPSMVRNNSEPNIMTMMDEDQYEAAQRQLQQNANVNGSYGRGPTYGISGTSHYNQKQSPFSPTVPFQTAGSTARSPYAMSMRVRPASTESLITSTSTQEFQEGGESVLTTRLQIPMYNNASPGMRASPRSNTFHEKKSPSVSPSILQKSESWHQLAAEQLRGGRPKSLALPDLPVMSGSTAKKAQPAALAKAKSSHSLAKQFEGAVAPDLIQNKQRAVEAYLNKPTETSKPSRTTTSSYSRTTQQAPHPPPRRVSLTSTLAADILLLDDDLDNVDEAFEDLFNASTAGSKTKSRPNNLATRANHSESTTRTSAVDGNTTIKTEVTTKTSSFTSSAVGSRVVTKAPVAKTVSPFAKFQQLDRQNSKSAPNSPKTPGESAAGPLFKFTDPQLCRSASTVKDKLLYWCQVKTKEYKNIKIDNFSTSWSNGLAFCALVHHFLPTAFDYDALKPEERRKNFELAFRIADDKAGIAPLLDVEDMVMMRKPDWKCVFTYVQSIYRRFKDED